jgi:hypothetical protein
MPDKVKGIASYDSQGFFRRWFQYGNIALGNYRD